MVVSLFLMGHGELFYRRAVWNPEAAPNYGTLNTLMLFLQLHQAMLKPAPT